MAVLEDFEESSLLGFGELRKAPVIQDKQLDARKRLEKPGMAWRPSPRASSSASNNLGTR